MILMIIEETTKIDMFQIQTMNNNTIAKLIIMIEIYITINNTNEEES